MRAGKVVTFNVGACYALVTGSQECGRAFQNAGLRVPGLRLLRLGRVAQHVPRQGSHGGVRRLRQHGPRELRRDQRRGRDLRVPFDSIRVQ